MKETVLKSIRESVDVKNAILADPLMINKILVVAKEIIGCYERGGKVLFCGNGGSAADAQHLSAELSGRFYYDRPPLNAEALHVNTSFLTAVANDYSFDEVYARMVRAVGNKGDILVGISTSGNSSNIVRAFSEAKAIGMITVGLTGIDGGKLKETAQFLLNVPSSDTPRIQESHIMIGHILCQLVEAELFPKER